MSQISKLDANEKALPTKTPLTQETKFAEFPKALSESTQARKREGWHDQQA